MLRRMLLLLLVLAPMALSAKLFLPELKVSYFRPTSTQLRKVYGNNQVLYSLDLNYHLVPKLWLWTGAGYWTNGVTYNKVSSRIHLVPCVLGLKFTRRWFSMTEGFVGLGANYTYLRIINKSSRHDERKGKGHFGGIVSCGLRRHFSTGLYFSPYVEYSFNRVTFSSQFNSGLFGRSIQVGGLSAGCGFGLAF